MTPTKSAAVGSPTSPEFLARSLQAHFPGISADDISVEPAGVGTSSATLWKIWVGRGDKIRSRLWLKISGEERLGEVLFYDALAQQLPIRTARALASGIHDKRGWLVLEHAESIDPLGWKPEHYQIAVDLMASLHTAYWGNRSSLPEWMKTFTLESAGNEAESIRRRIDTSEGSWLDRDHPEVFPTGRYARIRHCLDRFGELAEMLMALGLTLVHGDLWFYNILIPGDGGQPALVDWQTVQFNSGFWELAYFENLLRAMGELGYRPAPIPWETLTIWYRQALELRGCTFENREFERALLAARLIHPLRHWSSGWENAARNPEMANLPLFPQILEFQGDTFNQWDEDFASLFSQ